MNPFLFDSIPLAKIDWPVHSYTLILDNLFLKMETSLFISLALFVLTLVCALFILLFKKKNTLNKIVALGITSLFIASIFFSVFQYHKYSAHKKGLAKLNRLIETESQQDARQVIELPDFLKSSADYDLVSGHIYNILNSKESTNTHYYSYIASSEKESTLDNAYTVFLAYLSLNKHSEGKDFFDYASKKFSKDEMLAIDLAFARVEKDEDKILALSKDLLSNDIRSPFLEHISEEFGEEVIADDSSAPDTSADNPPASDDSFVYKADFSFKSTFDTNNSYVIDVNNAVDADKHPYIHISDQNDLRTLSEILVTGLDLPGPYYVMDCQLGKFGKKSDRILILDGGIYQTDYLFPLFYRITADSATDINSESSMFDYNDDRTQVLINGYEPIVLPFEANYYMMNLSYEAGKEPELYSMFVELIFQDEMDGESVTYKLECEFIGSKLQVLSIEQI